ncbi:hypothetical protein R3W88_029548 [Solanum pinnatisectum]|uniref:Uncharacterized protein n=1 Tax=Solanum pinnatisectum TaxID=50273 RepID=A0AAV9K5P3_9SOLN|nr:hypothetical protein R3W88_029548 [Solanum pinnatisectum]
MQTLHFLYFFLIRLLYLIRKWDFLFVSSQCLDDQKSLLIQLKWGLQYDSSLSTKLVRWNDNTNEFIALELDNESVSSAIENSSALLSLTYLEKLNLTYNRFDVGMPRIVYRFSILNIIDLSLDFIENLTQLREVHLDVLEYLAKFSNLTTLSLNYCNRAFRDTIFQVQALKMLDLSNNKILSGRIPNFPKSRSLRTISLSNNKFSGLLPESFSNLQNLSKLELSNCNPSGPLPSTMEKPYKSCLFRFLMEQLLWFYPIFLLIQETHLLITEQLTQWDPSWIYL